MIRDLAEVPGALPGRCDVCILGAGPAGIVTALELVARRPDLEVVLLEGGGEGRPSAEELDLYRGESMGVVPYPLEGSRLRFLGGTSNHWGGWCRRLDPEDFAPRPWVKRSGWPLSREALLPWYERAAEWCEIGAATEDPGELLPAFGDNVLALGDSELLEHRFFRFSPPTRFGRRYRPELAAAENLRLCLHANVVDLAWSGDRVTGVQVAGTDGRTHELRADAVVLALGGIETTRMLLLQAGRAPGESGIGSPMLGRCFADHFGRTPAQAVLPADLRYVRKDDHPAGPVMPVLALRASAQEALGTTNFGMTLVPQPMPAALPAAYAGNTVLGFSAGPHWHYRIQLTMEPRPDPDSRIVLVDERDRLGMRRIRLDWRLPPVHPSTLEAMRETGLELGRLGLGRLGVLERDADAPRRTPGLGFHHLGSARMAVDAEAGVVDADCRVHGIENLFVASSAVFPAYGFSNPTLTIVALAARLAEHVAAGGHGKSHAQA